MSPSIVSLGTALLACTGSALATQFSLSETYDHTNFFNKFNFFTEADPNAGFVVFQSKANAQAQGLIGTRGTDVYVGVDHTTTLRGSGFPGRNSVRLESVNTYNQGLIVARFTHLPANRCGTWPSFWTLGGNWPNNGEIDLYEGWNDYVHNQPAFHTGSSAKYGSCTLDGAGQSATLFTKNCDNTFQSPPSQYLNQGCTAGEYNSAWASSSGGTYAIEWTNQYIKLYSWFRGKEPANLASSKPDTSTWGKPTVYLKEANCDIVKHFQAQQLVFDITFCGNPAGTDAFWDQSCSSKTKQAHCADYVSKFPGDFAQTYFQIQDIRYFKQSGPTKRDEVVERAVSAAAPSASGIWSNSSATGTMPGMQSPSATTVKSGSVKVGVSVALLGAAFAMLF